MISGFQAGCILLGVGYAGLYAFQKKMFPPRIAKWLSRFFFYPTLPLVIAKQYLFDKERFTEVVPGVLLGSLPYAWDRSTLSELGVKAVVNCCDEYEGPLDLYQSMGITQLYIPTVDHEEPTLADMEAAMQFIGEWIGEGKVLVHCRAGHGRSAAIVYCYLLVKGMQPKEAQDHLSSLRKVRKGLYLQPNCTSFYESIEQ